MPQSLSQTQSQKVEQQLRLSQQQLQLVKLLEMPIAEFEEQVKKELMENPALEEGALFDDSKEGTDSSNVAESNDTGVDPYSDQEGDDYWSSLDYDDDDLPVYSSGGQEDRRRELPIADGGSFIEYLESQIVNYELTDDEERVLRYLIGSLDHRGFIDRPIEALTEELAFKEYLYVTNKDVEDVLHVLQSFDPAGIGARSTQECLLLQIDRKLKSPEASAQDYKQRMLLMERNIISEHYDLFLNKNKERLKNKLGLSAIQIDALFEDIKKLNVNPGFALNEAAGERAQTQIPDFIIETDPEGEIQLRLSNGEVPRLHVSQEYIDQLRRFQHVREKMTRGEKEGLVYTRQKVEAAQMFIESVKQRRRTLYETMKAIIDLQRAYFLSKDENDKVRLVLEDVARRTGFDVSTISRVCSSKYALLDGRIYPLSSFFKLTRKNAEGQEIDGRQVKMLLKEIVENEDKKHPYSDDKIVELMKEQGLALARRTVAKYRMELGIPSVNGRHG